MAEFLKATAVAKTFGGLAAVSGVDLSVDEGEIHCLIGPNGAGKSTLFKLIVGTYAPTAGTIAFRGENITGMQPSARVRRGMSIKMQTPSIFRELPVRQNIQIALQHHVAGRIWRGRKNGCSVCWNYPPTLPNWRAPWRTDNNSGSRSAWPLPCARSCC